MYELFLFDFDFTLVDSSQGIVDCIQYSLKKIQCTIPSDKDIRDTIGLPLKDAFKKLTGIREETQYNLFRNFFMERSRNTMCRHTRIFSDTVSTLKTIKANKRKIAIVSAKDKKTICKIAEKYRFLDSIDIIVGEHEVINQKPHPEQVRMVLNFLNITPDKALYVGDSLIDCVTAKNANVDFIAVATGTTLPKQFSNMPCISVVPCLKDIIPYI